MVEKDGYLEQARIRLKEMLLAGMDTDRVRGSVFTLAPKTWLISTFELQDDGRETVARWHVTYFRKAGSHRGITERYIRPEKAIAEWLQATST